jgi:alcohol dehydrogenase class IV
MEAVQKMRKFVIPEIVYGNDSHRLAGHYADRFDLHCVLVVSDAGVEAAGWTARVMASLAAAGIATVPFTRITPNPKDHEVMAGVSLYREAGCDGIVAVGGGSPMDCAKGIGIVSSNSGQILDYTGVDQVPLPMPPLICIPTTAGSAADISQFAIITDTAGQRKAAIVSKSLVPDVSLIDPLLTTTMPPDLTACTGMDALVHAIEAYVSNASSPFTDLHALEAIRLIGRDLPLAFSEPASLPAREAMMFASTQAGMAFSNASLGAVHAMAHSLGGMLDSPHGDCNARLLEHVIGYNFPAAAERYRTIAQALGLTVAGMDDREACRALVTAIARLRESVGITETLAAQGMARHHLPQLAAKAMEDACMVTNPRRPTQRDIEEIYAAAL